MASFFISFGLCILFIGGMLKSFGQSPFIAIYIFPFCFILMFNYFLKVPDVKIRKKQIGISKEIIFSTRFLMIEVESGVPVYDAFNNVAKVYPTIGSYFRKIIDQINMGTSMEDAINETIELIPSPNLRKILWQVLNSITTGADVTNALDSVLEQIIDEQKIAVEEYGRKLNPLAMFYMLIAVIMPSLGSTMLIIFSSFVGFKLGLIELLTMAGLLTFMQFMFYGLIKSSRPAVDI